MTLQVVGEAWLREHVREVEALASAKIAFTAIGKGTLSQPPVQQLIVPGKGETCIKSAHLLDQPYGVVKIASGFPGNVSKGIPSGSGMMIVLDAQTGVPLAVLQDGGYLTDLRTGAAGALAADLLCRPGKLAKVGIIGSGVQARFQLRAISHVREWETVVVFSRNAARLALCCEELRAEFGPRVQHASSFEECVRGADLVITTTSGNASLVHEDWIKPGATIIAVGADTPGKRELSVGILHEIRRREGEEAASNKRAKRAGEEGAAGREEAKEGPKWRLVCDRISQCNKLGELQHAPDTPVYGELGELLVNGSGRVHADDVIVCDLTGCGAQDAAIAQLAFDTFLKAH